MTDKGCDNCYYSYFDERAYPCSLCIRGIERTDMWQPSKKTKAEQTLPSEEEFVQGMKNLQMVADRKDEPICESCSKNPCKKKKMINDIGHWVSDCTEFDRKTEPQTCDTCKFADKEWYEEPCNHCSYMGRYEPKTEPQTEDKHAVCTGCDYYDLPNAFHPCASCVDFSKYKPKIEDEPQTERGGE